MTKFMYVAELLTDAELRLVGVYENEEEARRQLLIVSGEFADQSRSGWIYQVGLNATYKSSNDFLTVFSFEKE